MNELINHEAVYRTAPATPGLIKSHNTTLKDCNESWRFFGVVLVQYEQV